MTKEQILADLDYASSIAKDGANTPLLGGPIGLMWGCLVVPTLIAHGAIMEGLINLPQDKIGFIWMAYGYGYLPLPRTTHGEKARITIAFK
ncbi:hypothetical protein N9M10_05425 [Hellea sp.]|nr:hypothetical protein [Hellea sp.]